VQVAVMVADRLYIGAAHAAEAWVGVALDRSGFETAAVFDEVGALWLHYEERAERILVDVPVGLRDGEGDDPGAERACDRLLRTVLGPRADVVYAPPVRPATRRRRYTAAARVNERLAGRPLSRRAFEVSTAIAAVDELLQELPEARDVVAASHPDLCYRAFAGETLQHDPQTAGGYAERMRALADFDRDAPPAVQRAAEATAGSQVDVATVLDAVALAYAARPGPGELRSLPPAPPTDATGLPMQVCYRSETPLDVQER
jgi:predicted RNase H-like nuclease